MLVRFLETVRLTIKKGNTQTLCHYERGQEVDLSEEICKALAKENIHFHPLQEKGQPIKN